MAGTDGLELNHELPLREKSLIEITKGPRKESEGFMQSQLNVSPRAS